MSDVLQFKIRVEGSGLKDFEVKSKTAFSNVEREHKSATQRMRATDAGYTQFLAGEVAKRRQASIDNYQFQLAAHRRTVQAQLDEARRLLDADVAAAQQRSASRRNRAVNDYFNQLGLSNDPAAIRKATEGIKKSQAGFRGEIDKQMRENEKLIAKMNQQTSTLGSGGSGGGSGRGGGGGGNALTSMFGSGGLTGFIKQAAIFSVIHTAINAVISGVQQLISGFFQAGVAAVKMAGDFEKTVLALTVATGSARLARQELALVESVARNTTGLRLEAAEEGYTRLRNLGFAAETSRNLLRGLATQKIISGADENAINRVIVNLTQLSAGSIRASQDIKEIILAMPSIRGAFQDAFGTLDSRKIANAFRDNPDEAVEKLSRAMSAANAPAGGLNESLDKLHDAVITIGRAFGEPIVEPLTNSIRTLTAFILDNEATFVSWGQRVGDAVRGASDLMQNYLAFTKSPLGQATSQANDTWLGFIPPTAFDMVSDLGRRAREREAQANSERKINEFVSNNPNLLNQAAGRGFTFDFSYGATRSDSEISAQNAARERRELAARENERQRTVRDLQDTFKLETELTKNRYEVQIALQSAFVARTREEEVRNTRTLGTLRANFFKSEVSRVSAYYDRLIQLAGDDDTEVTKLQYEKLGKVSDINRDLLTNSYETQRRITELEREQLEERRRANIEFGQIQIDLISAVYDSAAAEIRRGIQMGTTAASTGYADLRQITENAYLETLRLTREKNTLELQNESLTTEQIRNLREGHNLAERRLAEQHKTNLIQIEQERYSTSIQQADEFLSRMRERWSSSAGIFSEAAAFFDPSSFSPNAGTAIGDVPLGMRNQMMKQVLDASTRRSNAEAAAKSLLNLSRSGTPLTEQQTEALNQANAAAFAASEEVNKYTEAWKNFDKRIPSSLLALEELGSSLATGSAGIEGFDKAASHLLDIKHKFEQADLAAEIGAVNDNLQRATAAGNQADIAKFKSQLDLLGNKEIGLGLRQRAEEIELYNDSLEGLNDRLAKLEARDPATILGVQAVTEKSIAREKISLLQENIDLETRLGRIGEDSASRYRNAWLRAIYDVQNASIEARESQIESQVKIANQTVFNADVARAGIMEAMAGAKGYTEIFQDAFLGVSDALSDGIATLLGKATEGLGAFGKIIANIGTQLLTMVTNRLMMKLLDAILPAGGGGGGSIGSGGGGGILGGLGGILGGLFGIGGGGSGTPGFNPNATSGGGGGLLSNIIRGLGGATSPGGGGGLTSSIGGSDMLIRDLSGTVLGTSLNGPDGRRFNTQGGGSGILGALLGGGGLKGLGTAMGQMAPMLGLSLGAGVGGSSLGGQILGGIGGLAGGLAVGIGTGAIGGAGTAIGGMVAAVGGTLAATGILAAIAVPLLIGGWLLGRNKQRRADEVTRTKYITDAFGQLDQILKDTRAHKYGSGQEAIDAANAVRETYRQQASSLKDKKTRNIALKEIGDRINPRIRQIEIAAAAMDEARGRFGDLIPEFATGGIVPGQIGAPRLVLAHGGEIIANLSQQTPSFLNAAADANIPGVRGTGGNSGGSGSSPIYVELVVGTEAQNKMFINGAKSPSGFKVIADVNKKDATYERRSTSF